MTCRSLDARHLELDQIVACFAEDAQRPLLVKARKPLNLPGPSIPLVLGPAAFYYVMHNSPVEEAEQIPLLRRQHQAILNSYKPIIASAVAGQSECLEQARLYSETLLNQLQAEETTLYPMVDAFLEDPRFTRELKYEHQGARSALSALLPLLESCLQGSATRRQIEKQELDLLHLLEHHIEREERGLYPLLSLLRQHP